MQRKVVRKNVTCLCGGTGSCQWHKTWRELGAVNKVNKRKGCYRRRASCWRRWSEECCPPPDPVSHVITTWGDILSINGSKYCEMNASHLSLKLKVTGSSGKWFSRMASWEWVKKGHGLIATVIKHVTTFWRENTGHFPTTTSIMWKFVAWNTENACFTLIIC